MDWNPLTWEGQGEELLQFLQVGEYGQSSQHPTGLCGHSTYIKAVTHLRFHKQLRSKDVMTGGCGKQSVLHNPFSPYCRFGFPQRIEESVLQVHFPSELPQRVCTAGSDSLRELPQRVPSENGLKESVLQVLVPSENCLKECVLQVRTPSENGFKECVLQVCTPSENGLKECVLQVCTPSENGLKESVL